MHRVTLSSRYRHLLLVPSLVLLSAACSSDTDDADIDAGADAIDIIGLTVFVTSTTQNAALGGIAGADAICAQEAAAAGLDGEFKAWLSTLSSTVTSRFEHADRPYVMVDGTVIADNWQDLTDGTLDATLSVDATGTVQPGEVWTGTLANGDASPNDDCAGFTNGTDGRAQCGSAESTTEAWTQNITPRCPAMLRLYCFQQ